MSEASGSIGQPTPSPAASTPPAEASTPPAPEPQPGSPENVTQHRSSAADRKAKATAAIEAARSAKAAGQPLPAPPPPAPAPPTTPPKGEQAEPAKPLDEAQVSKMIRAAQQADREAYESKQELRRLREESERSKAEAEKRKGMDPLQLLAAERGLTYEQLTQQIVEGKYKPATADQLATEKAQTTAEAAQARIEALEKQLAERDQHARVQQEHAYLAGEIKRAAETFPLLDAFDWAPQRVRDAYHEEAKRMEATGEQPDLTRVMQSVQDGIETDIRRVFAHDGALKRLLTANKDRVVALLGITTHASTTTETPSASLGTQPQSTTGRRNDPASLTRVAAQDAGTRRVGGTRSTPGERKANALKALLRAREAKQ